ncbi:helix-turn-helix transcriptional regulator [Corynebacterium diphtheriae]|uniref:helix-turn-helix transcriptional regulator n=1 Tax=Corynebacterium diphtheriae TaxID=1717 RepID=UPI0013C63F40|nr:helix-turn-helix domain-containing protein [Corynebacterium diphtheriae]MBG9355892.1 helix-turn-helix domain-containing protein [Corynebacterium diphtheriae bv. mitis]CAB0518887.1 DNA-binding protein [Corynebacterium diphtheriae]CAB0869356.1 DNA-binding protein [Corynebacterium diphtheriae]CAB0962042.1 DNA-binding protein [Corynebacterium diphtheriae]
MNSFLDFPDLVGTVEAARILGVSRGSVNNFVKKGLLTPQARLGKRGTFAFQVQDVHDLREDRRK